MKLNTVEKWKEQVTLLEYQGLDQFGDPIYEETKTLTAKVRSTNKMGQITVYLREWHDPERTFITKVRDHSGNAMYPSGDTDAEERGIDFAVFSIHPRMTPFGDINFWLYTLMPYGEE